MKFNHCKQRQGILVAALMVFVSLGQMFTASVKADEIPQGAFETQTEGTVQVESISGAAEETLETSEELTEESSEEQVADDIEDTETDMEVIETESSELESEVETSSIEEAVPSESTPRPSQEEELIHPMTASPLASPEASTDWSKLAEEIRFGGENANPETINVSKDISADLVKDTTILIKENQHIVLQGSGHIEGFGFESIRILKGGSLTIDGPWISNCQIIVEGTLNLKSGKISDTKLEGPTIFVKSGDFMMSGGEISHNEAIDSQSPQPSDLRKSGNYYDYAPITLYGGTLRLEGGKISNNKGFLRGGAIGAWGTEESRVKVIIEGGNVSENSAIHAVTNGWGGAIYAKYADFEMRGGLVSKNVTELGGGIALVESEAKFLGGTISGNSNGEYEGKGGGLFALNSNLLLNNVTFSDNKANGAGGGIFLNSSTYVINGGYFAANTALTSGGALAIVGISKGEINAGLFENNVSNGFWGGGAIYNDTKSELLIRRGLIKDNTIKDNFMIGAGSKPPSRQGGGIWNCPTGSTIINITNGLALFDNSAPDNKSYIGAGDDFVDITKYEFGEAVGTSQVQLASRMLGGGYRLWYQDGSFQGVHLNWPVSEQTPRYNPDNPGKPLPYNTPIVEKKGAQLVYKSVPSEESKALAQQIATSVFVGNFASGTGISGGAIANNGKLIFGDDKPYKLKISKTWTGDDAEKRPETITLKMYVGDYYIEDIKLTKAEKWTTTIEDFPDPDSLIDKETGKVLPINFKEENAGDYIFSEVSKVKDENQSTYSISLDNQKPTSIKVTKTWDDNNNQDGKRPEAITIHLLKNGEEYATQTLTAKEDWKWTFENLPKYEKGEEIKYTIEEEPVEGYETIIDGFNITNTYKTEKTSIRVNKTWDDNNDQDGKRPEAITIHLLKNGEEYATQLLTAKDDWKWTFENLPKYEKGEEIKYTIEEELVEGYETTVDGFNITNTHVPETLTIAGKKTWNDDNDKAGLRPDQITVHLLADGKIVQTKTVTEADRWTWTFKNLAKYKDGKSIVYTIQEDQVKHYKAEIQGFDITNTLIPEKPPVPGTGIAFLSGGIGVTALCAASILLLLRKKKGHTED